MSSQIQELIDKIKNDGIQQAQDEAGRIEKEAQEKAAQIIREAEQEAETIVLQAKDEVKKMEVAARTALQQASRDMLLALRKHIEKTLQKLITTEVSGALTGDRLAEIITDVVAKTVEESRDHGVVIEVNPRAAEELKAGILKKLQDTVKKGVALEGSDEVAGGFTISYDGGKSSFDFSDESLGQFLATYLNAQVADILKSAVH
ncbi:MAG: hypothetical protein KC900_04505 [Candidatus Omnitrophica bacterium]|nr:hypothetical protein [Candidatus Omnitrophota bacterium]